MKVAVVAGIRHGDHPHYRRTILFVMARILNFKGPK